MAAEINLELLTDPQVAAVNALPPHSGHRFFAAVGKARHVQDTRHYLDGTWRLLFNPHGFDKKARDFIDLRASLKGLAPVQVPLEAECQGFGHPQYVNVQYPWDGHESLVPGQVPQDNPFLAYARDFYLPRSLNGAKTNLVFEGVESSFYVYVNGKYVGYSARLFNPTHFDVTAFLKAGRNRINVLVFKYSAASWITDQDMWRMSGIFRSVYLEVLPKTHIFDIAAKSLLAADLKTGELGVDLALTGAITGEVQLSVAYKGKVVVKQTKAITGSVLSFAARISRVHPWSAEIPALYDLTLTVKDSAKVVESVPLRIGFRRVAIENGLLLVNGKRVVFHGVNRHEWDMRTGRCLADNDIAFDIRFMKDHNINALRCSHYPNDQRTYDLCDELGIYVIDEACIETHGTWQEGRGCYIWDRLSPSQTPTVDPKWLPLLMDRENTLLQRDRNHASVVVWSLGNESSAGPNLRAMYDFVKKADPSRPVHYESCWNVPGFEGCSDFYSRMYAKPQDIDAYFSGAHPRPMIECEYEHSMGASDGNFDMYIEREDRYPQYQGGFIWDFIDQGFLATDRSGREYLRYGGDFGDRPNDDNFVGNGIIPANRALAYRSAKAQAVKKIYEPLAITVADGQVTIRNKNLFLSTAAYDFVYSVNDDGREIWAGRFRIAIPPLTTKTFAVAKPVLKTTGETVNRVTAYVRHTADGLAKGTEVTWGEQTIPTPAKPIEQRSETTPCHIKGTYSEGLVTGDGKLALLHSIPVAAGVTSIETAGQEFVHGKVLPTFWRAATDNDRGNGFAAAASIWLAASKGIISQTSDPVTAENGDGTITTATTYLFPAVPQISVRVSWTMAKDSTVLVEASYSGIPEGSGLQMPGLPLFGLRFPLPFVASSYEYYGNGPYDTYCDRTYGGKLSRFRQTTAVADFNRVGANPRATNIPSQPRPQDFGNRTETRWLEVEAPTGAKLRFEAVGKPFQFRLIDWDEFQLESASHWNELPDPVRSYVTIIGFERGVGGDDSWGAPVHAQYEVSASKPLSFSFRLSPGKAIG